MRTPLTKKGHKLFYTEQGRRIFNLWFNRWTTPYSIAKAYYGSKKTKGGDASQYTKAIKELGFVDCARIGSEKVEIKRKTKKNHWENILWSSSDKKYESFRINLQPFYEYFKEQTKLELNDFDRDIIDFIFESKRNRGQVISSDKGVFEAIKHIILDYLRLPLGEIKTELYDWWTTDKNKVNLYLDGLKQDRKNMTVDKFNAIKKRVQEGKREIPISTLVGTSVENQIFQLMFCVPDEFTKKMVKASIPEPLYNIWLKNYEGTF